MKTELRADVFREGALLWSRNEIQELGIDEDAISNSGDVDGHRYKPFRLCWGSAPAELNVNNNNFDNENNGVGVLRKSCGFPH